MPSPRRVAVHFRGSAPDPAIVPVVNQMPLPKSRHEPEKKETSLPSQLSALLTWRPNKEWLTTTFHELSRQRHALFIVVLTSIIVGMFFLRLVLFHSSTSSIDIAHGAQVNNLPNATSYSKVWKHILDNNLPIALESTPTNESSTIPFNVHLIFLSSPTLSKWTSDQYEPMPKAFTLIHYLVLRSISIRLVPRSIYVYYDAEPIGPFWEMAKPLIQAVRVRTVKAAYNSPQLSSIEHIHDILKLRALQQHGGLALDFDVLVLKDSFRTLFNTTTHTVIGQERGVDDEARHFARVNAGVVLTTHRNSFLHQWDRQLTGLSTAEWQAARYSIPTELSRIMRHQVTLLGNRRFFSPLWTKPGVKELLEYANYDFHRNYAVKLWEKTTFKQYLRPLSFHQIVTIDTSLHQILRPLLMTPVFSFLLTCSEMSDLDELTKSLANIATQSFPLYEVVIGDTMQDASCSKELRAQNPVQFISSKVLQYVHLPEHENPLASLRAQVQGAWIIAVENGQVFEKDMLFNAQNDLVGDSTSFLEDYPSLEFRLYGSYRPAPQRFKYREGPFPELNPLESSAHDISFTTAIVELKIPRSWEDEPMEQHAMHSIRQSEVLRSQPITTIRTLSIQELHVPSLWPSKISARAYRSLIFRSEQQLHFPVEELNNYHVNIQIWKKCVELNQPLLVVKSNIKLHAHFDRKFRQVLHSLPINFGLVYFGAIHKTYTSSIARIEGLVQIHIHAIDDLDAYFISPRLARVLLENVYPLDMTLQDYMQQIVQAYHLSIYRSQSPLAQVGPSKYKSPARIHGTLVSPLSIHVVHLGASALWKRYIQGFPRNGGALLKPFRDLPKQHWDEEEAADEDPRYGDIHQQSPLYELHLLHLKLTLLGRYGGIVIDNDFGSDHLRGLSTQLPAFIAVLQDTQHQHFPIFPVMMAPVDHPSITALRSSLTRILSSSKSTQEKIKEARTGVEWFLSEHSRSVPIDNEVVVFPVGILIE